MHLCLIGTKPSHVSQNFFKFSILPGFLGGEAMLRPVVAILADSSQFTGFDCPQTESVIPDEEARGTSSH